MWHLCIGPYCVSYRNMYGLHPALHWKRKKKCMKSDHALTQLVKGGLSRAEIIQCYLDCSHANSLEVCQVCWSMPIFSTTHCPKQKSGSIFHLGLFSLLHRGCCTCVPVTVAGNFPTPVRHTWIPWWLHETPYISIRIPPCGRWSATLWHIHYVNSARPSSQKQPGACQASRCVDVCIIWIMKPHSHSAHQIIDVRNILSSSISYFSHIFKPDMILSKRTPWVKHWQTKENSVKHLHLLTAELPSCDQKWEWDFECGNVESTEGGEQTSWGSGGRCKPPSGVRGGAPEQKICE